MQNMDHPIVKAIKGRMAAIKDIDQLKYMDLSDIECQVLPF